LEVNPKESVNVVTTWAGKSTQEPPYPQDAGTWRKTVTARDTDAQDEVQEEAEETEEVPRASQEYHDTTALPFLEWRRSQWPTSNSASSSR
jgi:hypothetical protein